MRGAVEAALHVLVGQPMLLTRRAADMEMFHFGARRAVTERHGAISSVGTYALHVQCTWRLVGPMGIVTGRHDLYSPAGDSDREEADFQWEVSGSNRRDERLAAFFAQWSAAPPVVVGVQADAVGSLTLTLSGGFTFDVFPDDSLAGEHWRLLDLSRASVRRHFVVTGIGAEDQGWVATPEK